ncbi:glycerophosphodiester phosphodiesterase [Idiomarina sp. HP20-50]|uniref:glycerophosphodiester phosphodiesterase n=1 Tax=Idiomarina sp. HP20-50 TaxID=3070813 RepID=UPI00294A9B7B|nr:glycerophosphodiester phosphodiesterase [Idiomarina sp. HP20-50]MDV6315646.1 glycerophosphodiester phosphodiesterase [Idiomarina sp. HP20-50]
MIKPTFGVLLLLITTTAVKAQETLPEAPLDDLKVPQFLDIAHRGASGYLPEHTQASTVMAHGLGADYIEQDVQLSRDGVPIVLHDETLGHVTNVSEVFPEKHRPDGKYYVVDFSLEELKQLTVVARHKDYELVYPKRFSHPDIRFPIQTLDEQIKLIQELNRVRNVSTGIYVELKSPRWYQQQGYDVTAAVMSVLAKNGYQDRRPTPVYLQSFDPEVLRRLKREFNWDFPLIQLVGDNEWGTTDIDYSTMRTAAGLESVKSYAEGVGLWLNHVLTGVTENGEPEWSSVIKSAEEKELSVHVYTLRADDLPKGVKSHAQLRQWLKQAGVDGVFTDFPDKK